MKTTIRTLAFASMAVLLGLSTGWTLTTKSGYSTSFQNQRKVLRAPSGTLGLVYQKGSPAKSTGGVWLATSRDGGTTWVDEVKVASAANVFADAHITPGGDIDLVHSTNGEGEGSTNDVVFVRLQYDPATDRWIVARRAKVYDAGNDSGAYNAVLARDASYLWAAYRFNDDGDYSIVIRYSIDDGLTWQDSTMVDEPGPNSDETAVFAKLEGRLAVINYHQDAEFKWRWRDDTDPPGSWGPVQLVYEVDHALPSKSAYSVVTDASNRIHLVFNDTGIRYLRTDAGVWGTTPEVLAAKGATYPTLSTDGTDLWAIWQQDKGSRLVFRRLHGGTWGAPTTLTATGTNRFPTSIHDGVGPPVVAWLVGKNRVETAVLEP
jgi:hypothetical protein